ncbi:MAG: Fic family protein [Spirochaetales bacterium]|nr:Fic family protein [Spirochaetales bacterium]
MDEMYNNYAHISFQPRWTLTPKIYYLLGQCNAFIQAISKTPILPDYKQKLKGVSLGRGAQATTAIEGNTLTLEEVKKVQEGKRLPLGKEYMEKEVANILKALNIILEDVVAKKKIRPITPELMCEYHRIIGEGLGDNFKAIPGKIRAGNVTVSNYRAPDFERVERYLKQFCEWMKIQFHFSQGQSFMETILQAIVTHVYIAWIHPFGDGNGRTARLLEFYLLIRAGVPDIASHVLSNHYNETREEYYRQLENATRKNDLTDFIEYAVTGFTQGLLNTLLTVQENQLVISWTNYVYEQFDTKKGRGQAVKANKNKRTILLNTPHDKPLPLEELKKHDPAIAVIANSVTPRSYLRYLDELIERGYMVKTKAGYRVKAEILSAYMAVSVDQGAP